MTDTVFELVKGSAGELISELISELSITIWVRLRVSRGSSMISRGFSRGFSSLTFSSKRCFLSFFFFESDFSRSRLIGGTGSDGVVKT